MDASDSVEQHRIFRRIRTWEDFRNCFRARCDELRVARNTIDEVGGLPAGLSSKLLAPGGLAKFGPVSLTTMAATLGLAIFVVEDPQLLAHLRHRLVKREEHQVRHASGADASGAKVGRSRKVMHLGDSDWGRVMAIRRANTQSPGARRAAARTAAKARWRKKPRQKKRAP